MNIVGQLDETRWRDFVRGHPLGNIFQTPEMFEVFSRARGCEPKLWAATDGNDRPLALLIPIEVTLMGGLLRQVTTRTIAYGSVLCAPGPEGKQALSTLLEAYNRTQQGSLFTELRNLSDLGDLQPVLEENDFIYEDHLNYLIDLDRPSDMVLQSMGRRTRKQIRRALRQGKVVIEEASHPERIQTCYRLLQESYAAAQVPLADYSLFEATFDVLHSRDMVKFLLARLEDSYIAGSVELVYKDTIYGWYGGLNRAYGDYIPNELLLWYIFKWGADNGYKVYDFGGAGKPDEEYGVRNFKAKFGGDLVCFGRNTCVHAPLRLQLSRRAYQVFRRFLS